MPAENAAAAGFGPEGADERKHDGGRREAAAGAMAPEMPDRRCRGMPLLCADARVGEGGCIR